MVTIALKGMRFHSFHGYYAEEQSVGNNYEVDVIIQTELDLHTLSDDLTNTINYETIYGICKDRMIKPVRLIETVAKSILDDLCGLPEVAHCKISIRKMNPLLGGLVDYALVEMQS
ncbi:MAG: dihydroneopterin aldolase [Saprospiraceae bacterium]|nr:dihydroneopterin aldolase [Saprospiraceae bacterium]